MTNFFTSKGGLHIEHSEIIANLKILGLDIGAGIDDIHSAFRKLAREFHPDVTGSKSDFRFKQITGAYNALKNITHEELESLAQEHNISIIEYKAERLRREEAEKLSAKIDGILERYEQEFRNYYANPSGDNKPDINAITFRLKSSNPKVINAALRHSGHLVNRVEFRRAITDILRRSEISESTANIAASLPFDDMTRKLIAMDSSDNAANLPAGLILSLIGSDSDVMESFLIHVKPEDAAMILRRWPSGKTMNMTVIRFLLAFDDARVLVPLLGAMRDHFPKAALQNKKRLSELESHSTAAVRAWAKKLSRL
ncbi:MAG: DnaJ domain-containing protein [Synergistaceae bacterium]|nr:DnaJ domain-containing protein [Synergistaceae bacterium]